MHGPDARKHDREHHCALVWGRDATGSFGSNGSISDGDSSSGNGDIGSIGDIGDDSNGNGDIDSIGDDGIANRLFGIGNIGHQQEEGIMSSDSTRYDAIIIGFGKAGKTLGGALAAAGQTVALIEESPRMYGGTCINVACIPTKALVERAKRSSLQGGSFEEKAERYAQAVARKDELTEMLRNKNYHKLADAPGAVVIDGRGSFVDAHHIAVEKGGERTVYEADKVFINTGSRPFVPSTPGLAIGGHVHVSEMLLDLDVLPRRLVIIGGGYIGVEFASMFANFGSEVTIVQGGPAFIPREDAEVAAKVLESLEAAGVTVLRSTKVARIEDGEERAVVHVNNDEGDAALEAEAVLVATGRRPNIEGLNLEAAGVEVTERGAVKVDEHLHTTAPTIFAMGDVVGGLQFTYISLDDFRIVRSELLGDGSRTTANRGAVPYSVFVDPPFSRVGLTEQEARDKGFEVQVGTLPAAAIPKAHVLEEPVGMLKAVVDAKSGQILGAHLFCAESHEMVNLVKVAMDAHVPYTTLRDAVFTHPTMSEAFNDLFAAVK